MYSLLHEVINLWVDSLDNWHKVVKNVFCVVHGGVHKVPVMGEKSDKIEPTIN